MRQKKIRTKHNMIYGFGRGTIDVHVVQRYRTHRTLNTHVSRRVRGKACPLEFIKFF